MTGFLSVNFLVTQVGVSKGYQTTHLVCRLCIYLKSQKVVILGQFCQKQKNAEKHCYAKLTGYAPYFMASCVEKKPNSPFRAIACRFLCLCVIQNKKAIAKEARRHDCVLIEIWDELAEEIALAEELLRTTCEKCSVMLQLSSSTP